MASRLPARHAAMSAGALLALAVCIATALGESAGSSSRPARASRPNIVVIMTDDQTQSSVKYMRNVRRLLARRGTTFRNNFVSYPFCCPSRATFLTGQYAHNHRVLENSQPTGGYAALDHSRTLPVWLRRAGYDTTHVGKYLNGYGEKNPTEIPPGWSSWFAAVDPTATDMYDYTLNENGRLVRYGRARDDYKTDVEARIAERVIRRRPRSARPFFLYLAVPAPHDEQHAGGRPNPRPAVRHKHRAAGLRLPRPASFNEADVSDKPAYVRNRPRISRSNIRQLTNNYRARIRSLLAVDDAVARIVRALRRTRQLENTVIVFTSDNGYFQGEHRFPSGKFMAYDPATRVPLVIRGPGFRPHRRVSSLVANIDLAPTILDLANARANRVLDGVSLLRLMRSRRLRTRSLLLEAGDGRPWVRPKEPSADRAPDYAAVRTRRYLWVEQQTGETELYDLRRDPDELRNLNASRRYRRVRATLRRRLARLRACAGRPCRRR